MMTRGGFIHARESLEEVVPVCAGPKDPAASRALEELPKLPGNKWRDQGNRIVVWNAHEHDIAVCAAISTSVVSLEIDLEVLSELLQLSLDVIACD